MSAPASSSITLGKIRALAEFLPTWYPDDGWPDEAPLTREERNVFSEAFWRENEITWLRVLGTILSPGREKTNFEETIWFHFNAVPSDIERMFAYWLSAPSLQGHGVGLLQSYNSMKSGNYYPALCGIVPLVETVIKKKGFRTRLDGADYPRFYDHFKDGIGVQSARLWTEIFFETRKPGEIDSRFRFNRHRLMHGASPDAVILLDAIGACLVLDMVVSTVETGGHLFERILR